MKFHSMRQNYNNNNNSDIKAAHTLVVVLVVRLLLEQVLCKHQFQSKSQLLYGVSMAPTLVRISLKILEKVKRNEITLTKLLSFQVLWRKNMHPQSMFVGQERTDSVGAAQKSVRCAFGAFVCSSFIYISLYTRLGINRGHFELLLRVPRIIVTNVCLDVFGLIVVFRCFLSTK